MASFAYVYMYHKKAVQLDAYRRLPTVRFSVVTNSGGAGVGPQVNKFEPVSSDDHQMSVEGGLGPMAVVGGGGRSYVRYRGGGGGAL